MYPVSNNFHAAVKNNAKTRVRVYLFGPSVDPTDDNDVQTIGTLLKMLPEDTDSNSRIEESGIVWSDLYNKDKNPQIGDTVSKTVSFSIINTDGAYSGYNFQRCKIYLDVEYSGSWLACPMGVYIFQTPEKTHSSTINVQAFDLMQELNETADSWFNGLSWSTGITVSDLLNAIATHFGTTCVIGTEAVNTSMSFTSAPFTSLNYTFRDILAFLAEMTGTIARFDNDGKIEIAFYKAAQIDGSTYTLNVDAMACGVFNIVAGEYSVAQIDGLLIQNPTLASSVSIGGTNSVYSIRESRFFILRILICVDRKSVV